MDPKQINSLAKLNDLVLEGTALTLDQRTLHNHLLELEKISGKKQLHFDLTYRFFDRNV